MVNRSIGRPRKISMDQKKSKDNLSKEQKKIKELEKKLLYAKAEIAFLKGLRDLTIQENKKQK